MPIFPIGSINGINRANTQFPFIEGAFHRACYRQEFIQRAVAIGRYDTFVEEDGADVFGKDLEGGFLEPFLQKSVFFLCQGYVHGAGPGCFFLHFLPPVSKVIATATDKHFLTIF